MTETIEPKKEAKKETMSDDVVHFETKDGERYKRLLEMKQQILDRWNQENQTLADVAYLYVDVLNDYDYIKGVAEFTAMRYSQFVQVLPRLNEIDALIGLMESWPEDEEHFPFEEKNKRITRMKLLKEACKNLQT